MSQSNINPKNIILQNITLQKLYEEVSVIQKHKLQTFSHEPAINELQESVKSICQALRDVIEIVDGGSDAK